MRLFVDDIDQVVMAASSVTTDDTDFFSEKEEEDMANKISKRQYCKSHYIVTVNFFFLTKMRNR